MKFTLYGNGELPWCSEVHHQKSLHALGHECQLLQENRVTTDTVLQHSLQSDALIWIHTHGFRNAGRTPMTQVLNRLRGAGVPTIAYHLDAYKQIPDRWAAYQDDPYMRGLSHFFSVDQCLADWLNTHTEVRGHYLPPGVFGDECYISDQPSPHANDLLFVGSRRYHASYPMRPKLIDWLRREYGARFTHVGGDGDTGTLRGDDLNRCYANSKIAVGDSLICDPDYPGKYWSDRIPETLGRGGMLLHPRVYGLDEQYVDGQHLVMYQHGDFADLKTKIDHYLDHHDERERIRIAGHTHAKANHTYSQRWQQILDTVFG